MDVTTTNAETPLETVAAPEAATPRPGRRWWRRARDVGGPIAFLVAFVVAWQLRAASLPANRKFLVPTPGSVVRVGFLKSTVCQQDPLDCEHARSEILHAMLQTLREAATGLIIATLIGVLIAILMSQARWIERSIFPWAVALQTVPILALVPFISIRYGYGFKSRVIVCVLIAVFPILTNTHFGLLSADEGHHDLFTLHRAGRLKRLFKLQLPGSLPAMFTGLRISAGLSVVGAIVGEFFFRRGDIGLGHMIEKYRALTWRYDTPALFATILVTCLLGISMFIVFSSAANLATRSWYEPATTAGD